MAIVYKLDDSAACVIPLYCKCKLRNKFSFHMDKGMLVFLFESNLFETFLLVPTYKIWNQKLKLTYIQGKQLQNWLLCSFKAVGNRLNLFCKRYLVEIQTLKEIDRCSQEISWILEPCMTGDWQQLTEKLGEQVLASCGPLGPIAQIANLEQAFSNCGLRPHSGQLNWESQKFFTNEGFQWFLYRRCWGKYGWESLNSYPKVKADGTEHMISNNHCMIHWEALLPKKTLSDLNSALG